MKSKKELINIYTGLRLQILPYELYEASDKPISDKARKAASKSFFEGTPVKMKGRNIKYMTNKKLLEIIPPLELRLSNYQKKYEE